MLQSNLKCFISLALCGFYTAIAPSAIAQNMSTRDNLKPLNTTETGNFPRNSNPPRQQPYTLGGGDLISIDIFNVPEYSKEYQVLIDGTVNLPLLNNIDVGELTLAEASELISREYVSRGLLRNPIIAVNLVTPRPVNVSVVGEVRTPGAYIVPFRQVGNTGNVRGSIKFPTIIDALDIAKGINASADTRNIRLIRNYKGQEETINVNLWNFIDQGDANENIILRDGDRILISSAPTLNPSEVYRLATANFSANLSIPISVNIVGEVNRPGPYTLSGSDVRSSDLSDRLQFQNDRITTQESLAGIPTVSRAIKSSGGLTARADIRNIEVRRQLPDGQRQTVQVNLWELLESGDFQQDAILQNGDQIFIPTSTAINEAEVRQLATASFSPNNININVVGEVESPGIKQLQPNITLQQAILAAGSFDQKRAKDTVAQLIRLNPDGTVTRRSIPVDFSAPINEETNPQLLNNDIVFIERSALAARSDRMTSFFDPIRQVLSILGLIKVAVD